MNSIGNKGVGNSPFKNKMIESLLFMGWRFPFARLLSSLKPIVLMYHGVPKEDEFLINKDSFEGQIEFLDNHYQFIRPDELERKRHPLEKIRILLTFDDSFRNNAEVVVPILKKYRVPALFFVCSRHARMGKYLWFNYLEKLEKYFHDNGFFFRGEFMDMTLGKRQTTVRRIKKLLLALKPHPSEMYLAIENELPPLESFISEKKIIDSCAGMTENQIVEMISDPLFSVGVHTVDHPYLSLCEAGEIYRQISENKRWLEEICNKKCLDIAYPLGNYDNRVLEVSDKLGFKRGFLCPPFLNSYSRLEISRMGIYSPSLNILAFKVQWGNVMHKLKINVG